jgi:hypothetical protein
MYKYMPGIVGPVRESMQYTLDERTIENFVLTEHMYNRDHNEYD